ncbi:hypothetical protein SEA_SHAMWOW_39 [Mycobacterium phage ShamWow]|uniref:Uncharacterized protein n=1 Tax=Mycobacterium phage CrystalP TaxID=1932894 RepID=A0A1L7DRR8_9CAUD|nr:hypothetical protein SEA_TUCO_40 [Mycobacterium phage Tuco]APU02969.1 hypothetical protein SEA_CRYSTALP_39 [Mycobacterium phage CrystalP]QGJ96303.1 hypothetical protein SEA_MYRALE_39 [Mycobacterium phage Myrale]QYC54682.1 hypothetical protein SEA_SHAMWOW_39 [Mycobacterium phage ShamWow]
MGPCCKFCDHRCFVPRQVIELGRRELTRRPDGTSGFSS